MSSRHPPKKETESQARAAVKIEYQQSLVLIESVTSHGPVDAKRHGELASLFKDAKPGIVYVTAFPDRSIMGRYLSEISWETEVWRADAPTHLIHFNGERFLGPYGRNSAKGQKG